MKAPPFAYEQPRTLDAALAALADHGETAVLMAGGQSLIPVLNFRMSRPEIVIDLAAVEELRACVQASHEIHIGAMVTHARLEDGACSGHAGAFLQRVAAGIAFRAIRNRGTIGGSLAHADPAADWLVALSCLRAEVALQSRTGKRRLALADFVVAPMQTTIEPGELIAAVVIPVPKAAAFGWHKIVRKAGEFAEAIAAVRVLGSQMEAWIGALGAPPVKLHGMFDIEALASPRRLSGSPAFNAIREAIRDAVPDASQHRIQLAAVSVCQAVADARTQERPR